MAIALTIILCLHLQHVFGNANDDFQVIQVLWQMASPNSSVTIACEYTATPLSAHWEVESKLWKKWPASNWTCLASGAIPSQDCSWEAKGPNRYEFTLSNLSPGEMALYICEFSRTEPIPVKIRQGKGTIVFPAAETPNLKPTPCIDSALLWWILFAVATFFCAGCLTVTCIYRKLRRRCDPDGNTEYMDMRKVSPGRANGRDVNYNSHQVQGMLFQHQ